MSTTSMASTTAAQSDSTLGLTHPDISGFSKHATSRDYILDLADPSRPSTALFNGETRVQKHPAVFKCSLCPKKFTRAYNLRSHLRTHTEERSFICSICGKAFVRQHDLTRHEGLHSGEVKFMCAGQLQTGQSWGCGRRFARADALGRHFRSEAGRVCIKPLLDEEAATKASVAGPSVDTPILFPEFSNDLAIDEARDFSVMEPSSISQLPWTWRALWLQIYHALFHFHVSINRVLNSSIMSLL